MHFCRNLVPTPKSRHIDIMNQYNPHERLVKLARPTASLGRLIIGIVLIVFGFLALNIVYFSSLQNLPDWAEIRLELYNGTSARALWLTLLSFVPLLVALRVVLKMVHSRSLNTLMGQHHQVIQDFWRVFRVLILLFAVVGFLPYPDSITPTQNKALGAWAALIPFSLVLIFLQIATEELLFRGYLQSQLAARFSNPVIWMLVPSMLFGLLHFDPATYGSNAIWLAGWSALFGLAAADLTARSGNLGPALALHFTNNISALMWNSMNGHWDGLALFVLPIGPADTQALAGLLPVEALIMLCSWLVARIALRR